MKVTGREIIKETKYEPHSIIIEFRTEEEFNAFYSIFNHTDICEFLEEDCKKDSYNCKEIRKVLNTTNPNDITDSYDILFEKLRKRIKKRK